jgi:UDP-N-acetylglucosamine 2-epimerase (non-hydrolysing)
MINSMKKPTVMTVFGTRPEIIRLSETMKELDRHFNHILVHTGQNYDYELSEIFFKDLGLRKPDYFLDAAGGSAAETVGRVISTADALLATVLPDALLILGDTNSALASYAAKRRKIPVFHMEAGNRCFDDRVPEELNRRIVDRIADINLVYSDRARDFLLLEGFAPDRVIKTGSPMFEVLAAHREAISDSGILATLGLEPDGYFVLSAHREENIDSDKNLKGLIDSVKALAKQYKKPIIFSAHPRTRKRIDALQVEFPREVQIMKPLGFHDYVKLESEAYCTVSDSGTINEESSILDFPAVNIRETHERLEAMDEAAVVMTGLDPAKVVLGVELARVQKNRSRMFPLPIDYANPVVSKKVARIILSYTDYVRRVVWHA